MFFFIGEGGVGEAHLFQGVVQGVVCVRLLRVEGCPDDGRHFLIAGEWVNGCVGVGDGVADDGDAGFFDAGGEVADHSFG